MTLRVLLVLILALFATPALAQLDPLRNVSGTTPMPGGSPWVGGGGQGWSLFHGYSAHVTYISETGPEEGRSEVFSTNWLAVGIARNFGRGFLLLRGRGSLEPMTIPDNDGYPQMLQYVSPETGGVLIDRMRPHDLIGEAAVHAGFRPSASTLLHAYVALVGDPALGTAPFAMRDSGADFPQAPFAYDVQEESHDATSVVTLGFNTRYLSVEGSVFHEAVTLDDHTEIDSGDIDSRSVRITLTPSPNLILQASRGELGEDLVKRDISTFSLSYGTPSVAATALWTRRERENRPAQTAYGFELTLRGGRHTLMGRAEWVDRPDGFPDALSSLGTEQTTHFAIGYIAEVLARNRWRLGAGVNIDYHTQSHELPARYGHKPQSIYSFVRFRTTPAR